MNLFKILTAVLFVALLDLVTAQAPCSTSTTVDVVFLLNSYYMVKDWEFNKETDFIMRMAKKLNVQKSGGHSRAAVVQYSYSASLKVPLNQYLSKFEEAVKALSFVWGRAVRLDKALSVAMNELRQNGRKNVPQLVVILVQGSPSNVPRSFFKQIAEDLTNDGVYIIAVGVLNTPRDFLQSVTVNDSDVFKADTYHKLRPYVERVSNRACVLIDKCASSPCKNGATCANIKGNYRCTCKPGYSGRNCDTVPCSTSTTVDVVFLLNSHGDVRNWGFYREKDFIMRMANKLNVQKSGGHSRAAVVQYSDSASLKVPLNQFLSKFEEALLALRFGWGRALRLEKALGVAAIELRQNGRKNVPQLVVILIQGGPLNGDYSLFKQSAQVLKNDGVYIIAVGVRNTRRELLQSVTVDDSDVFKADTYHNLRPYVERVSTRACVLIDKCASGPCKNGATCANIKEDYRCSCKSGYSGRNCDTDINDCASVTCQNGGTCVDLVASYRCDCIMGYFGKNCLEGDGCLSLSDGDKAFDGTVNYAGMTWFETPSVVRDGADGYQILGRHVHMDFVQENLRTKKKINFGDSQSSPNNIQLKILADTVFVKGKVVMKGIKNLTIFSRRITFVKGSQLDLSAPHLTQRFVGILPAGANGAAGKQGANGPTVELYTDLLEGYVDILTHGGNGHIGQNGANGRKAASSSHKQADRNPSDCANGRSRYGCTIHFPGYRGIPGLIGGRGGNAGTSGNGGYAGSLLIHVRKVIGKAVMKTCPGKGAPAAKSGKGGDGGLGGRGGRGINCKKIDECRHGFTSSTCTSRCVANGHTGEAARGPTGRRGNDGLAGKAGSKGDHVAPYLQKSLFGSSEMKKYPLVLINLMTRYAEDLIWANNINSSQAVLNFIVQLTEGRADASFLRKVAKRRLTFLNKDGFDRFGRNEMFAPLMKWDELKKGMQTMINRAKSYETSYNTIKSSVQDEIASLKKALPKATLTQVSSELERVVESRRVAISQKLTWVAAIGEMEASMNSTLADINVLLPSVYDKTKFNKQDLFAVLQGIAGFLGGVKEKDPLAAVETALGVMGHFSTKCNTGTLQGVKDKIKKWMTFGQVYPKNKKASELDFDQMDVTAVPEMMKANLEMNKQRLTADLVCMLEERSLPRDKAKLQELMERFFIAGSTRIDLIAKVIDLDNEIGGHNFNILNLNTTVNDIKNLTVFQASEIANSIKERFLDDLLTSYQEIETRFAKHVYRLYKSFEFRSLWNIKDRFTVFQRRASEAAKGTGKLQGVLELTKAMQEMDKIENKVQACFSRIHYSVDTHRWHFTNTKDKLMFSEIQNNGTTKFSLDISTSCKHCYNVRLLKMYVELYGDNTQSGNNPPKVLLKLRRISGSYFRDGEGKIREFRQTLGNPRKFEFNRFAITNSTKCIEEKKKGVKDSLYCMDKDDKRFQAMCCHFLSDSKCDDKFLGAVECQSPFGTYELSIPVDASVSCQTGGTTSSMTDANCKDYDRTQLTKMNVWIRYMYWTRNYPTGPDDVRCGRPLARFG